MSEEANESGEIYGAFSTDIASTGYEALRMAEVHKPDLILLDIIMPGMNGFEVLSYLKKSPTTRTIPVLIITGLTDDEDEELGLRLGAVDYIVKPFNRTIVLARIKIHRRIIEQMRTIEQYSLQDPLTGVLNRRSFDLNVEFMWQLAIRRKEPVSVMMIDIDNFKYFNDQYGHSHGDLALKTVANTLAKSLKRETDMLFRWGGEEFLILLPNTSINRALYFGERILTNIRNVNIPNLKDTNPTNVTASIGIASTLPTSGKTISELVRQADQAMYNAKGTGKNRVCISRDTTTQQTHCPVEIFDKTPLKQQYRKV
jgi:diguanylate cyclase (GGDEF)-like protein